MDGEIKIPVCNCGCNETQTVIRKFDYERLFIATMQCTNCGFAVSAIENDFDKAERTVIEEWCFCLKTKDYPVWKRGKKDAGGV